MRFRLLREMGRGATATVYLARDEALTLDVALKVLHPQLPGQGRSDSLRRFFADARLAAGVRHPGVVAIYDVDEAARAVAMEWIAGGTLRQRLREHPAGLPTAEVQATARQPARRGQPRPRTPGSCTAISSRRTCCCARRATW